MEGFSDQRDGDAGGCGNSYGMTGDGGGTIRYDKEVV